MSNHAVVRTVLGDIPGQDLGFTQTHEHLLIDHAMPLPAGATASERRVDNAPIILSNYYETRRHHTSEDVRLRSIDDAVEEVGHYVQRGGNSIVDATSIGIGRDPQGLAEISRRTGANVIMGAGYYTKDYHDEELAEQTETEIASHIVDDIQLGANDTRIRSGIIGEIGLSWPHHPVEEMVLRAACQAQRETGAAVLIHPGRDSRSPARAIDITTECGVDANRVIMSHVERTIFSTQGMRRLADTGCYVEFDLFGQESSYYSLSPIDMPNDATRVDYIVDLIEHGSLDKILIAQDTCHKTNLSKYGGEGYTHILDHVLPLMRRKGMTETQIDTITVSNSRKALEFEAALI